jgi:O-antigen/teichoic acid export membrane protein
MGEDKEIVFQNYVFYILPLTIITLFLNYFDNFFRVLFNATIGVFLKEIVTRLLFSVAIVLFFFALIDINTFIFLYFLSYSLPTLILGILLLIKGEFVIQKPRLFLIKKLKYLMLSIGGFGMITGFSNIAILQIDSFMLKLWTDLSSIGIYTTAYFFGTMILLPARSIKKIATIVLSESWKNNDTENILTIYTKSTITQLIIGVYLFLGIWINIDNISTILGDEYNAGRYVILLISLTNLTDMFAGVNQAIISTSKRYAYAAVFMVIMLILIVITNWIFIPIYGIVGAAFASFLSMLITTFLRYIFVWQSFKLQPYNYKHLIIIAISGLTYFILTIIPSFPNAYIDILIKGSIITTIFGLLIYISKVSEDINLKIEQVYKRYARR